MLGYFLRVTPFEIDVENFLLVFNECVILTSIGHMFAFSKGFTLETPVKVTAGWTFVFLILSQVVVNVFCYLSLTIYQTGRVIRQKVRVFLHKRAQAQR